MNGKHWLAFGVGLAVGYLVLPYALNMASGLFAKKA
jgi:hypothetical protein